MREIKFRAWDNVDTKMYYTGEEDNIHFYFDGTGIIAERFYNTEVCTPEGGRCIYGDSEKLEHLKYLEYTGLKDKNGVEIFDEDVVIREIFPKVAYNEDFIGEVKMYEGRWWIDNSKDAVPLWTEIEELSVLGNIYEHPELLGDSK